MASVDLKRKPALLAWIMPRSLKLSPAAMVSKPQDCRAFTVVSLDWGQRIWKPVISPLGATSRVLQNLSLIHISIGLTDTFENLVVLRSFSKAHGLAGIRAGYGILPPQLTVPLDNITHPYICSCPARAVAQAALEDEGFLDHTRQVTAQLKAPFLTCLLYTSRCV